MHSISSYRLASALALSTLLGAVAAHAASPNPIFQPLNTPASKDHNPGKFVWADLFTADPVAATKFYCGLFGWTANKIEQDGRAYTVFSNGKRPVAGLAPRAAFGLKRASRWVGYIAVNDINATLALVPAAKGEVRAPAREFPDRGWEAILTDNEGNTIGVLQSSSGDTADREPKPGDWNWFELYTKKPEATSDFYGRVFGYKVEPDERTERKNDFLLSNGGLARGGVAPLPADDENKPGWLGVVRVENLDEVIARLPALGGEVLVQPRPVAHESRFAIIADSTGGAIGLVEYPHNSNPAKRP